MSREYTNKIIELCEQGMLDWEDVARECMQYMSEDQVEDMATSNEWVDDDDEDEEEYDDGMMNESDPPEIAERGW